MTSRKFYIFLEIKVFFRIIFLTRTWNIGMMEYWNDDLKKMIFLCLIPAKRIFRITHLSIFSLICSFYPLSELYALRAGSQPVSPTGWKRSWRLQNPAFQCSNIPTFPTGRRPYGPEANCEQSELTWRYMLKI